MSEKLSDRLERFEFSDELGNGDFSLIQEAAAIVRAVEDAQEFTVELCRYVGYNAEVEFEDDGSIRCPAAFVGKRVKLVEVVG